MYFLTHFGLCTAVTDKTKMTASEQLTGGSLSSNQDDKMLNYVSLQELSNNIECSNFLVLQFLQC